MEERSHTSSKRLNLPKRSTTPTSDVDNMEKQQHPPAPGPKM